MLSSHIIIKVLPFLVLLWWTISDLIFIQERTLLTEYVNVIVYLILVLFLLIEQIMNQGLLENQKIFNYVLFQSLLFETIYWRVVIFNQLFEISIVSLIFIKANYTYSQLTKTRSRKILTLIPQLCCIRILISMIICKNWFQIDTAFIIFLISLYYYEITLEKSEPQTNQVNQNGQQGQIFTRLNLQKKPQQTIDQEMAFKKNRNKSKSQDNCSETTNIAFSNQKFHENSLSNMPFGFLSFEIFNISPLGVIILNDSLEPFYINILCKNLFENKTGDQIVEEIKKSCIKNQQENLNIIDPAFPEESSNIKNLSVNQQFEHILSLSLKITNQTGQEPDDMTNNLQPNSNIAIFISKYDFVIKNKLINLKIKVYKPIKMIQNSEKKFTIITLKNLTVKINLQPMQRKTVFSNQILESFSHELKTPLNCILQMLTVLENVLREKPDLIEMIDLAKSSSLLLLYQINNILDNASIKLQNVNLRFGKFQIMEIVHEISLIYFEACKSKKIVFKYEIEESLIDRYVFQDKNRIIQILVNLIDNSIKFTHLEGVIKLIIKTVYKGGSEFLNFKVKDNGIGFDKEKLLKIQEILKLEQAQINQLLCKQEKIFGLGFELSNKLIKVLNDDQSQTLSIRCEGQTETSISFQVAVKNPQLNQQQYSQKVTESKDIPENQDSINQISPDYHVIPMSLSHSVSVKSQKVYQSYITPSVKNIDPIQQASVLIVDDVPFNQLALQKFLKCCYNIQAESAFDGYEAINYVQNRISESGVYKLIFMDIEMPGMNGFEATKQILRLYRSCQLTTNIIMCSAYDTLQNIEEAKEAGMIDFLRKPVRQKELERIMSKYYF